MTRDAVTSDQLPPSGLPFSVAVRGGGLLFLSGQVAQDPVTGELVDGDVAQQSDQILRNIAATLAAIGKDLNDVIRVGVYLTDMSQFGAMNEVYRRHFTGPYPARTAIGVAALPLGVAGFTGPPRLTGLGNQIPGVLGGELPQDIWMHGVLLAGVDLRQPVSSWRPGIGAGPQWTGHWR